MDGSFPIVSPLAIIRDMADADSSQKDLYFVAVKIFLEKDGKLLILKDKFDCWDLPGGRIKKNEFEKPIEEVVSRKMTEELGPEVRLSIDSRPVVLMRHERIEASVNVPVRIFGIGYKAKWQEGEIHLSEAHKEMQWVDISTFDPANYFTGGWLRGVREYLAHRES